MTVRTSLEGSVMVITLDRPAVRNAVDGPTASALAAAFRSFEAEQRASVAVLTGSGGHFCGGADLRAIGKASGNRVDPEGDGPLGPTRMHLSKPAIAAIEGYAVAGGLELALLCDLRVASSDATLGVFCRRFGVPLIDGGTVRLPRLIGRSRALDLILTGRPVGAEEGLAIGLVNRVCAPGGALEMAIELAEQLAALPQTCLREDRQSVYEQESLSHEEAMRNEFRHGLISLQSAELADGLSRYGKGEGRHGASAAPKQSS